MYYLEPLRALKVTLSRWSRLHLQLLNPTNLLWIRVVGYDTFALCVSRKEGLCPSSGDVNRLNYVCTDNSMAVSTNCQITPIEFVIYGKYIPKAENLLEKFDSFV
jgi:hypothetical protein